MKQFEYTYALMNQEGVFTGKELTIDGMMDAMLGAMGISSTQIERMADMNPTSMINRMYFTVMGLIPLLLFAVIVDNSLIVDQVDSGSMAYVLSTPTKRSAVANTQAIFLDCSTVDYLCCNLYCTNRSIYSNLWRW